MRIVVGGIYQETNTFSPFEIKYEDFKILQGEAILQSLPACGFMEEAGVEAVPSVYARILPSGCLTLQEFRIFLDQMTECIRNAGPIDGIWFNLHGAMTLSQGECGEALLLETVRKLTGDRVPIAVTLDFHANINQELVRHVNIISGYRTVPHVDEEETGIRTVKYLIEAIKRKQLPVVRMLKLPVVMPGELVMTADEPTKTVLRRLRALEEKDHVVDASFFLGMAWADTPISTAGMVLSLTGENEEAMEELRNIAREFWNRRGEYRYGRAFISPAEAVRCAENFREGQGLLFISDSGDNVTAGAAGDNAYLLSMLLDSKASGVLFAGIADGGFVGECRDLAIGDRVERLLGGTIDPAGSMAIRISGVIKNKKTIKRNNIAGSIETVTVRTGGTDILITSRRCAFTSPENLEAAGADIREYNTVVVKLGYLFDELKRIAGREVIALTPGNSCLKIDEIQYHRLPRPVYPLDTDVAYEEA